MRALEPLIADVRYAIELALYLRKPATVEQARANRERDLARRPEAFLEVLKNNVYAKPNSPYLKLLTHAGIEFGDVERQVRRDGLEATLHTLYEAGVYVTSEELKARQPIRRNGLEFATTAAAFDNADARTTQLAAISSSGSSGERSPLRVSLDSLTTAAEDVLVGTAPLFGDGPYAYWTAGAFTPMLYYAKANRRQTRVFFTNKPSWHSAGRRERFRIGYIRLVCALYRRPLPPIEVVPRDQAIRIAHWLAQTKASGKPVGFFAHCNPAVRVCLAAREAGLDISGTTFLIGGEPFTPGKAAVLASVGAIPRVSYAMSEVGGMVGVGCAGSLEPDDVHLWSHKLAMIQRPHEVMPGESVGSLFYTSLTTAMPKLLLNLESGDYATVTTRACDCVLGQIGFNTHLHDIRSHEKLTSEGTTFIGSRLYDLVEQTLPARFGGGISDYQLVEEEQPDGLSRASIVVSPRVGPVDDADVIATVLRALATTHSHPGGETMVEMWRQGSNLQVVRREPHVTGGAKVLPLHILRRETATSSPK